MAGCERGAQRPRYLSQAQPSDGAEVWIKSGQVDVRSKVISPVAVNVGFVFPPALGVPQLHIQDLIDDFDDTLSPAPPVAIDTNFATARYTVSVFPGAIYNLWWSQTEHRHRLPQGHRVRRKAVLGGLHHEYWLEKVAA